MLLFLFCLLSQFRESATDHPSLEEYKARCVAGSRAAADAVVARIRKKYPEKNLTEDEKQKLAGEIAEARKRGKTADKKLPDIDLTKGRITVGDVGILNPKATFADGSKGPIRVRVLQVLSDDAILCEKPAEMVIRGIDTSEIADDDLIEITDRMCAFGTFSYVTAAGTKRTVVALERWKHDEDYESARKRDFKPEEQPAAKPGSKP